MRLFKKKKEDEPKLQQNELFDIPVGSMIELSDMATFNLEEKTSQTFELKAYKKYEADGFLRYMYDIMDEEEIIFGVDVDLATGECNLVRFVIDSEEEFTEALGDTIMMDFEDPNDEDKTISVEYNRFNTINTKMTIVSASADDTEEHYDVELQDFSSDDGSILMVELYDDWFIYYVGEPIERENVNIFRIDPNEKK
jgi:hypothetical protein